MPSNPADILRAARKLLERPEAWTQCKGAKDAAGKSVHAESDAAVRWCSVGAIRRAAIWREKPGAAAIDMLGEAIGADSSGVVDWNDAPERTHAEVLAAFDAAIAIAEKDSTDA